jgi:hypothetical protein
MVGLFLVTAESILEDATVDNDPAIASLKRLFAAIVSSGEPLLIQPKTNPSTTRTLVFDVGVIVTVRISAPWVMVGWVLS